jgi:predicted PurR-regulated permease PerM
VSVRKSAFCNESPCNVTRTWPTTTTTTITTTTSTITIIIITTTITIIIITITTANNTRSFGLFVASITRFHATRFDWKRHALFRYSHTCIKIMSIQSLPTSLFSFIFVCSVYCDRSVLHLRSQFVALFFFFFFFFFFFLRSEHVEPPQCTLISPGTWHQTTLSSLFGFSIVASCHSPTSCFNFNVQA